MLAPHCNYSISHDINLQVCIPNTCNWGDRSSIYSIHIDGFESKPRILFFSETAFIVALLCPQKVSGLSIFYFIYLKTIVINMNIVINHTKQLYMDNTTLGSMAFGFDLTLSHSGSTQVSLLAAKCPLFVAGDALKGRFITSHILFSSHQYSSKYVSKQIGDVSSSVILGVRRQHIDLVCSCSSSGGAGYILWRRSQEDPGVSL